MPDYDKDRHWSSVGDQIRGRSDDNLLAGDDAPYYRYKADLFSTKFLPQVPIEGHSVLEVGCGAGRNLSGIASMHPGRLVGCDVASEMVALSRQRIGDAAEVVQVDGAHLPFSDKEFDVVTTVTVLQHNPDAARATLIEEICRVSGGEVFLFEDTSDTKPHDGARTTAEGDYQNFFGRPVKWYADACARHGFTLVDTQIQETFVSHLTFVLLSRFLDRGRTASEGEPFSKLHMAIEERTLPITRHLDRVVKFHKSELTLMHFERQAA
ncbi:MAG: class I SAM-dependent methyltransferase [Acidimicrobiales bacterium]